MANLSDFIEKYIKTVLKEHTEAQVDVQRNELAEKFNCVPSQINYVLRTRFTTDQGFIVESRRGGGGYIRITKVPIDMDHQVIHQVINLIGDDISQQRSEGLLGRLSEEKLITFKEMHLLFAAIKSSNIPLASPVRDRVRALILKSMLEVVLRKDI